mgnify:CR=1 FL=1
MLYEDESVSRIAEATTLWQSIANSKWFHNASIILFLNKVRARHLQALRPQCRADRARPASRFSD